MYFRQRAVSAQVEGHIFHLPVRPVIFQLIAPKDLPRRVRRSGGIRAAAFQQDKFSARQKFKLFRHCSGGVVGLFQYPIIRIHLQHPHRLGSIQKGKFGGKTLLGFAGAVPAAAFGLCRADREGQAGTFQILRAAGYALALRQVDLPVRCQVYRAECKAGNISTNLADIGIQCAGHALGGFTAVVCAVVGKAAEIRVGPAAKINSIAVLLRRVLAQRITGHIGEDITPLRTLRPIGAAPVRVQTGRGTITGKKMLGKIRDALPCGVPADQSILPRRALRYRQLAAAQQAGQGSGTRTE